MPSVTRVIERALTCAMASWRSSFNSAMVGARREFNAAVAAAAAGLSVVTADRRVETASAPNPTANSSATNTPTKRAWSTPTTPGEAAIPAATTSSSIAAVPPAQILTSTR